MLMGPKMRVEPRLGMGKGKSSKNMSLFRLVMGPWKTLRKQSNWPAGFLWGENKHVLKMKPQGQTKARGKKVSDWVNKAGSPAY